MIRMCDFSSLAQCHATESVGLGYCIMNPISSDAYASHDRAGNSPRARFFSSQNSRKILFGGVSHWCDDYLLVA